MDKSGGSSSSFEAEPYARVRFHLVKEHGTHTIHQADCPVSMQIGGLKTDMSNMLGVPAQTQQWLYAQTHLENNRTLMSYGLDGRSRKEVIITVKITNP